MKRAATERFKAQDEVQWRALDPCLGDPTATTSHPWHGGVELARTAEGCPRVVEVPHRGKVAQRPLQSAGAARGARASPSVPAETHLSCMVPCLDDALGRFGLTDRISAAKALRDGRRAACPAKDKARRPAHEARPRQLQMLIRRGELTAPEARNRRGVDIRRAGAVPAAGAGHRRPMNPRSDRVPNGPP